MNRSKYRAIPTYVDGIRFASKKEAARYAELLLLQKAGEISHLLLQPKFDCVVNGQKICTYRADFSYFKRIGLNHVRGVVEDVKGFKTPEYKLKKKLVEALYPGTRITEVGLTKRKAA